MCQGERHTSDQETGSCRRCGPLCEQAPDSEAEGKDRSAGPSSAHCIYLHGPQDLFYFTLALTYMLSGGAPIGNLESFLLWHLCGFAPTVLGTAVASLLPLVEKPGPLGSGSASLPPPERSRLGRAQMTQPCWSVSQQQVFPA